MAVKIEITVRDAASKELADIDKRAHNLTPAWQQVGALMLRSVQKNFAAQGRPTRWLPLSLSTLGILARKVKRGGKGQTRAHARHSRLTNKQILIDTVHLKNSINYQAIANGVEVGTNTVYGLIHQMGGMAGRGRKVRIPARPYLVVQDEDVPRVEQILGDYVVKGQASSGE